MTVSSQPRRTTYNCSGGTGPYGFPYRFLANSDLLVTRIDALGARTVLVLGTDYSVAGVGLDAGGTVSTIASYADGKLELWLQVPIVQSTAYPEDDPFPSAANEAALDKLTLLAAQAAEVQGRAFAVPPGETGATLPSVAARAGKVAFWNNDGSLAGVDLVPYGSVDRQPLSPLDFGALYDGTTEDTAAHVACLTAAAITGRGVLLPRGQTVTAPFSIPAGVRVWCVPRRTTIRFKRQTYADFTALVTLGDDASISGVIFDHNDALFANCQPVGVSGSTRPRVIDCEFYGVADYAVLFYGCTDPQLIDCTFTPTGTSTYRLVQAVGCTGGLVSQPRLSGSCANHAISVDTSTAFLVFKARGSVRTLGGFGVSFTTCTNSHEWGSDIRETQFEAYQMTSCTACTMGGHTASWTGTNGQDFARSMDGCIRCVFQGGHLENSYKAASAIAADAGISYGNSVLDAVAHNCAVRGTTGSTGYDTAVFIAYNSTYANDHNLFSRCVIHTDTGSTVTYGYLEGGGSTGTNRVEGMRFIGAGTVTTRYAPTATTQIEAEQFETYTPVLTAASGAFGTSPAPTAACVFRRCGPMIEGRVTAVFPSGSIGTAAGALIIRLPVANGSDVWMSSGREGASVGAILSVTAQNGYAYVRTYDNAFPAADGATIDISFRAALQ